MIAHNNNTVPFKDVPVGSNFYMHLYPGNIYTKQDQKHATITVHRSNPEFRGCKIYPSPTQPVQRAPIDFDPNALLDGEDYGVDLLEDGSASLLETPEDLLG